MGPTMSETAKYRSQWSRRFAIVSILFLISWGVAILAGGPRRMEVYLGLYGFVFHMIFSKGYALLPTYFNRSLRPHWLPFVHFPLTVGGVAGLAFASIPELQLYAWILPLAATAWMVGVVCFVGGFVWTVRGNITGRETATGNHNRHRRQTDRFANLFMPIALGYLFIGSYLHLSRITWLPDPLGGGPPVVSHLLAVGTATLLIYSIGFRLLPRFFRSTPPRGAVVLVLPLAAIAPLGLASSFTSGTPFLVFAIMQMVAMIGFTIAIVTMAVRAPSLRIGLYAVVVGSLAGLLGMGLGLWFIMGSITASSVMAHIRLNLMGFIGLTIIGVVYQFYPPTAATLPGSTNRTAGGSIGAICSGIVLEVSGLLAGSELLVVIGQFILFIGIIIFAYLVGGVLYTRRV